MNSPTFTPTRRELFLGFLMVGLQGFGGVLPLAHRVIVEEKRWLDEAQFTEILGLGQILPGPNIVNVSVVLGARFQGPIGALLAFMGLMAAPFVIALALAATYDHFSSLAPLHHALAGVSAVAPGLIIAVALKMAVKLERSTWCIGLAALSFAAITVFRLPLMVVLAIFLPGGVALAFLTRKQDKTS